MPRDSLPDNGILQPARHIRDGAGLAASLNQVLTLEFHRLHIGLPLLIQVVRGQKRAVLADGSEHVATAGQMLLLTPGQAADIINTPAGDGAYEAHWLAFDPGLIDRFQNDATPFHQAAVVGPHDGLAQAVAHAHAAVKATETPLVIVQHRLTEVLHWLALSGARFPRAAPMTQTQVLRARIEADPGAAWSVTDLTQAAKTSEASLRRRLHAEGFTPAGLVVEVRMNVALGLLQTTNLSIQRIAEMVGYDHASRFTLRFRERFGFPPSCVRGHRESGQRQRPSR